MWKNKRPLAMLIIVAVFGLWVAAAQDVTEEAQPTVEPPPEEIIQPLQVATVSAVSPKQVVEDQSAILSITGQDFVPGMKVTLLGKGELPVSQPPGNNTLIQAVFPNDLPVGSYIIEVRMPDNTLADGGALQVQVVAPTPQPLPPTPAPLPTEAPPPTEIPGAPSLIVRSFSASPATIRPGDTVTFTIEIVNLGTRAAQGVALAVDPGGKFIAANGQATVLLPDLAVSSSFVVSLPVVAANDTPAGPQTVGVTLTYRDFTGQSLSGKGTLTVNVRAVSSASQVTMARYLVNPNPVLPGEPVTISVLLTNSGNKTAGQVLLQMGDGILLAGPQGNSFPVGDMEPGASVSIDMPLIVSTTAKAGPQSQAVTINYLQDGESKSSNSSMTLAVANVVAPSPLLLLDAYNYGKDFLKPGEQFTLNMVLKNIGEDNANNMLITFGTVQSSGGLETPDGSTTTTPSNTFAPLGAGDTLFAGTLEAGGSTVELKQDFIVSGSVDSGIYSLPITLRYQKSDGSAAQENLRASIVVIVPPQITINQPAPLPETVNVGDSLFLSLEIANRGRKPVNFSNVTVEVDNGEVVEGADTYLGPLRNDDNTSLNASVIPQEIGPVKLTVTFHYTDDLNQPKTLVEIYQVEAIEPPPPPEFNEPPLDFNQPPPTPEPTDPNEILGRFLLGLLGLGS